MASDGVATISIDRLRRWSLSLRKILGGALLLGLGGGLLLGYLTEGREVTVSPMVPWISVAGIGLYALWRGSLFPRYGLADLPRTKRKVDHYSLPFSKIREAVIAEARSRDAMASGSIRERDARLAVAAKLRGLARRSAFLAAVAVSCYLVVGALAVYDWLQPGEPINDGAKRLIEVGEERFGSVLTALVFGAFALGPGAAAWWHWENVKDFVRRAMAYEQPDAATAQALDARPPTLFLRSFADDSLELPSLQQFRGIGYGRAIRFEEAFAALFNDLGPLVAIGEPGERVPNIGAAKSYFSDDEWQHAVLSWMDEALLIALAVGPTPAVTWELRNALERGHARKLILILPPPRPVDWWAFWRWKNARLDREARIGRLLDCFARTPWEAQVAAADWRSAIMAFVEAGDRLVVMHAKRPIDAHYQMALAIGCFGLLCGKFTGTRGVGGPTFQAGQ